MAIGASAIGGMLTQTVGTNCYPTPITTTVTATTSNTTLYSACYPQTVSVMGNYIGFSPVYYQYPVTYQQPWVSYGYGSISTPAVELTPEQKAQMEQDERDRKAKQAAREKRAKEALELCLTAKQKESLNKDNGFEVEVNGKLYRIIPGEMVRLLDKTTKKTQVRYCIHPDSSYLLPPHDVALAQKLLLEANEAKFLKTANAHSA